jgi:hypothetical protein
MKVCCTCHFAKPLEEFNLYRSSKDGRQDRCRQCSKDWYKANSEKHRQNTKLRRRQLISRNRDLVWEYLKTHPCVDCGETDPPVLDFDHVRGKKLDNISRMIYRAETHSLVAEMAKCEMRCANCHRRKTAKQFGWYAWLRQETALHPPGGARVITLKCQIPSPF